MTLQSVWHEIRSITDQSEWWLENCTVFTKIASFEWIPLNGFLYELTS